jgi:hypothetical protein
MERLNEERPELIERLHKTGRRTKRKNGDVIITPEVWCFIKDVW